MADPPTSRLAQTGRDAVYAAERRAMAMLDRTIRAAEEKTTEIRERSEQVARDRVTDVREITDGLIDQARSLSGQADSIIAAIDDAITRVRSSSGGESPATASGGEAPATAEVPPPREVPDPPRQIESERDEAPSAGARLLAMQMAVSGSSRQEIEDRLRDDFEVEQAGEIAASVLGDDG